MSLPFFLTNSEALNEITIHVSSGYERKCVFVKVHFIFIVIMSANINGMNLIHVLVEICYFPLFLLSMENALMGFDSSSSICWGVDPYASSTSYQRVASWKNTFNWKLPLLRAQKLKIITWIILLKISRCCWIAYFIYLICQWKFLEHI